MSGIAFYIYCAEWSCRAQVFALAAADASLGINGRHLHFATIGIGVIDHQNSLRLAAACADAAFVALGYGDAVLLDPHGTADTDSGLILWKDRANCPCRTHLRTAIALGTAETALERHLGLHKAHRVN